MIDSKLPAGCEEAARKPPKAGVGKATSTREATMHAQIDDLLTPTYVLVDDFLPKRRGPGRPPRITDAELITLAIAQVFMGLPNDRQFWRSPATASRTCSPTCHASRAPTSAARSPHRSADR